MLIDCYWWLVFYCPTSQKFSIRNWVKTTTKNTQNWNGHQKRFAIVCQPFYTVKFLLEFLDMDANYNNKDDAKITMILPQVRTLLITISTILPLKKYENLQNCWILHDFTLGFLKASLVLCLIRAQVSAKL